ncbi:MAG TPA: type VI secretion system protein TssR [Panacibacter sp.]|nr:type VI secretion system protein TssR [Panacibacter sp.]
MLKNLCFLFLFLIYVQSFSQKLLGVPDYIEFPDGISNIPYDTKAADDKSAWIVCSDRAKNKTYKDERGTVENDKVMDYMQRFYVSEEKGNFLHLYLYEDNIKVGGSKLALKSTAKDYGWAPKDKLLLWLRSIVNVGDRTAKKALPVLKDNTLGNSDKYMKDGLALIFADPGLTQENNNAIKMFQFLFVYKEDPVNNSILIGKAYESSFIRIQNDVLGWISKDIVQAWGNRVCLEPNWYPEAVAERKSANIKSSLFLNKEDAISWTKGGIPNAVWDIDPYTERKPPMWKRMPILNFDKTNNIAQTGYVTPVLNGNGEVVVDLDTHNDLDEKLNIYLQDARKINMLFVVDAGNGMQEYVESVANAIKRIVSRKLSQPDDDAEQNSIKYGAVVYRDEADANCPSDGDLSVVPFNLNKNESNLIEFLEEQSKKTGCTTSSKSKAVNQALYKALRMLVTSANSDQNNFIVLLGGAKGKENPNFSDSTISSLIATTQSNVLIFQVQQGTSNEFASFPGYYGKILKNASMNAYKYSRSTAIIKDYKFVEPIWQQIDNDFGRAYKLDYPATSAVQGKVAWPLQGQAITADNIVTLIDTTLSFTEKDLERKINDVSAYFDGIGNKKITLDPSLVRYFEGIGKKLKNRSLINKYSKTGENYQFFIPGFTSPSVNKLENPVFKNVLFVSDGELDDLKFNLKKLTISGTASSLRDKITDAYTSLIATYAGDKKIKELIARYTPSDVLNLVIGLPTNNKLLKKYKISDFKREDIMSDEDIFQMQSYLQKKYESISSVVGDPERMLKLDTGTFYWIEEDLLP